MFFNFHCSKIIFGIYSAVMGQKGCSRDYFTAARQRRKRRENCRTITCFSPRSMISCWFNLEKWKGGKNNVNGLQSHDQDAEEEIVLGCLHGKSSSSAQQVSGGHDKDSSFSLGVGFGLIYLLATRKINKMAELCKQMETLLQKFKKELQNEGKDANMDNYYTPSKPQEVSDYAIQHVSLQDCPSSSWEQEYSESDITSNSYHNSNSKLNRKGKIVDMDQLEAELEAELEHLQLQLDTEVMLNYSNKKYSEIVVEDSAPEESQIISFGEVFEQPEIGNMEYYQGVPPRELERRLHELQEVRQQERIRELESALECAIHKLDENRRELSWWKDTASVVFQQISVRSRSLRQG